MTRSRSGSVPTRPVDACGQEEQARSEVLPAHVAETQELVTGSEAQPPRPRDEDTLARARSRTYTQAPQSVEKQFRSRANTVTLPARDKDSEETTRPGLPPVKEEDNQELEGAAACASKEPGAAPPRPVTCLERERICVERMSECMVMKPLGVPFSQELHFFAIPMARFSPWRNNVEMCVVMQSRCLGHKLKFWEEPARYFAFLDSEPLDRSEDKPLKKVGEIAIPRCSASLKVDVNYVDIPVSELLLDKTYGLLLKTQDKSSQRLLVVVGAVLFRLTDKEVDLGDRSHVRTWEPWWTRPV